MPAPRVCGHGRQRPLDGPTLVHHPAGSFRHGQRIFRSGIQHVPAHQRAADIRSRPERGLQLAQKRRGIAGRFAAQQQNRQVVDRATVW